MLPTTDQMFVKSKQANLMGEDVVRGGGEICIKLLDVTDSKDGHREKKGGGGEGRALCGVSTSEGNLW